MTILTKEELYENLVKHIRSGGVGGKTTAEDLRTFLTNAIELMASQLDDSKLLEPTLITGKYPTDKLFVIANNTGSDFVVNKHHYNYYNDINWIAVTETFNPALIGKTVWMNFLDEYITGFHQTGDDTYVKKYEDLYDQHGGFDPGNFELLVRYGNYSLYDLYVAPTTNLPYWDYQYNNIPVIMLPVLYNPQYNGLYVYLRTSGYYDNGMYDGGSILYENIYENGVIKPTLFPAYVQWVESNYGGYKVVRDPAVKFSNPESYISAVAFENYLSVINGGIIKAKPNGWSFNGLLKSFSTPSSFAKATGYYSHAIGNNTTASGHASHAEGYGTKATGTYTHAKGYYSQASGWCSHAEGDSTQATGSYSHAGGLSAKATGSTAFNHSYAWGNNIGAAAAYSAILGGVNNQIQSAAQRSVILGGQNINATKPDTVYTPNMNAIGDVEIDKVGSGIILRSPNGTRYRISVADNGTLVSSAI